MRAWHADLTDRLTRGATDSCTLMQALCIACIVESIILPYYSRFLKYYSVINSYEVVL